MSLFLSMAAMLGQLCRRRAYAPTSNTASQDNHEKINSWVSFIFPLHDEHGAPLGGPSGHRSSATTGEFKSSLHPYVSSGGNLLLFFLLTWALAYNQIK